MAAIESPLKERITPERLLDLRGVLDDLMRSKIVSQRDAEDILIAPRTAKQMHMHPLEIIAERELDDPRRPGKKLDLDELTHWLCEVSHQPYYRIDPLKVNVNKTTEVMSYAFAQRHNILAIEVREDEIVIASAQPFMSAWEGMLVQTLRGAAHRARRHEPAGSCRATCSSSTRWRGRSRKRPTRASRCRRSRTSSRCSNSAS